MSLTHTHFIWTLQSQQTGLARSKLFAVGRHVLGCHIWEYLANGAERINTHSSHGYLDSIPNLGQKVRSKRKSEGTIGYKEGREDILAL
jgi:hypothetical protein